MCGEWGAGICCRFRAPVGWEGSGSVRELLGGEAPLRFACEANGGRVVGSIAPLGWACGASVGSMAPLS